MKRPVAANAPSARHSLLPMAGFAVAYAVIALLVKDCLLYTSRCV